MSERVFAPAKINLTLQVGAARADGMHPLQSAVVFADVGDWIEATAAPRLELVLDGPFALALDQTDDNLVLRAAAALNAATGQRNTAALRLTKNLPLASGIGGGSADAAATLKALNSLWRLGLADAALADIGATLGADVPVCVGARPAWMTGIGEQIAALSAPTFDAVLVNPLQPLSTAAVFGAFDALGLGRGFRPATAPVWRTQVEAFDGIRAAGNDLEAPARALMPALSDMMDVLRSDARVLYGALSGSGATMFALLERVEDAHALEADLQSSHPHWWVRATRLNA